MFETLFMSKNQKLVKVWKDEHKVIAELAGKILESYENNDIKGTKKYLNALEHVTVGHLMTEDVAFYDLLKHPEDLNNRTIDNIKDFRNTFQGTKSALMKFIAKHAAPQTVLDDEFAEAFKGLVGVVVDRINYEEKNLYHVLAESQLRA